MKTLLFSAALLLGAAITSGSASAAPFATDYRVRGIPVYHPACYGGFMVGGHCVRGIRLPPRPCRGFGVPGHCVYGIRLPRPFPGVIVHRPGFGGGPLIRGIPAQRY